VHATDVLKAKAVLERLQERGMPNYFGEQRFGRRENNDKFGAALIRNDNIEVLRLLLGDPMAGIDQNNVLLARRAFEARDNEAAMKHWPRSAGMERRVLARLMKTTNPRRAVRSIDEKIRRLWVSALQSKVFNDVLAARVDSFDKVENRRPGMEARQRLGLPRRGRVGRIPPRRGVRDHARRGR
jgi:tRNA pseudouridine13 synthase